MKGLPPNLEAALFLILIRQQYCRRGAVVLGDDVELHAGLRVIHGEQAKAFAQAALVFHAVVFAKLAPVAVMVAKECALDFFGWDSGKCALGGNDAAHWELPFGFE